MNVAVIGIGSNIDPHANIAKAKALLARAFTIQNESRFVATKPVGYARQADFINGAVLIETALDRLQTKAALKAIEQQLGRTSQSNKFGPRSIDLDILVWNHTVADDDFYTRDFVKQSVLELIPDFPH